MAWYISEQGQGKVIQSAAGIELKLPAVDAANYHNAQISDYDQRRQFSYQPPLRLSIIAKASKADLCGTGGFGFWNHPFAPNEKGFRLPQALWFFFSSPPNAMALAKDMPENGWKAASFNAKRWPFYALAPTAPFAVPLMNIPSFYDALWPIGQKAIGVNEFHMDKVLLNENHLYTLDWLPDTAIFSLDGKVILEVRDTVPKNPLGFVAWLDNQYAIISPKGRFGFGLMDIPEEQSLFLEEVRIEQL